MCLQREFERFEIFCNLCLWENFTKVNSDYVFKNINIVNNSERTILGVVCRSLNLKIVEVQCMKSISIDLTYAENDFIKMYGCILCNISNNLENYRVPDDIDFVSIKNYQQV